MKRIFVLLLFAVTTATCYSQSNTYRTFYLTQVNTWLGDTATENSILNYVSGNGFTYILFYDLHLLNYRNPAQLSQLASFISRAKVSHGVLQAGAVGENETFFENNIIPYNNHRTSNSERFDVLNYEFEFWLQSSINLYYCSRYLQPAGCTCDTAGAWSFAWNQFKKVDSLCTANRLVSEVYVGWPTKGQMQNLAAVADRILLHAYRTTDEDVYGYSHDRLINIASLNRPVNVLPIFSAEPGYMGPWLSTHPLYQPYQTYSTKFDADSGSWKQFIHLQGYVWFHYFLMPQTTSGIAAITANGPTSFCNGGNVTLTANAGTDYLWSPGGETTSSISVSQPGTYTVHVIQANGASATSPPVTVTVSSTSIPVAVNASGPTDFCLGDSVILQSGPADTYAWSNGSTTQSISVTQSGSYTVMVQSGSCTAVSDPVHVSVSALPLTPVITSSGPLTFCSGNEVILSSDQAGSVTWSTGDTTSSIVVTRSGSYTVSAGTGSCIAVSSPVTVSVNNTPPIPIVTPDGPLSLCDGGSVTLTSSPADVYYWTTGETTSSIVVTQAGSYFVTVYSGTCSASSASLLISSGNLPSVPGITTSGPTTICFGHAVTLTSSPADSYLWSDGSTSASIDAIRSGDYSVTVFSGNCSATSVPVTITVAPPLPVPVVTASGPTTICPGGSVTLSAPTATYYFWSTSETTSSIDVSEAGSYFVTIYTGGCDASSASVIVSVDSAAVTPVITASGSTIFCAGDSVTLTSSPASSYLWSTGETTPSIVITQSGSYSVSTQSGSCNRVSLPVNVSVTAAPAVPVVSSNGQMNLCPGSAITLISSASGQNLWSDGSTTQSIVVTDPGTYWVRSYSSGSCFSQSNTVSVELLSAPADPSIAITGSTNLTSANPSVTLTATNASSYAWTNGATTQSIIVQSQGNYRVTVTSSDGCSATSNGVIVTANACTPPATPVITTSGTTILSPGQSVVLTSSPSGGYLWSTGATTQSISVSMAGTYTVRVYNAGNCYSTSLPLQVYLISPRLANPSRAERFAEFTAYPNPSHEILTFSFRASGEKKYMLKIYSLSGREIESRQFTTAPDLNTMELDVESYTQGMYFAYLIGEERTEILKFIVE